MKKILQDCKGAVTVMVTLLLIPAILITGTGVDLARIYSARSIVQDANQLACNSALAEYDALLQDLYGLFGLMKNDHEFATMVDEYVKIAVLGEDWVNRDLGSFQLFYGSNLECGGIEPLEVRTLANLEVLRRQIEEYAKLRAPIIAVEKVLDKLDTFERVQEDAKVIKQKLEVDDCVEDVDKAYRDVYDCIVKLSACDGVQRTMTDWMNAALSDIKDQFKAMYNTRERYQECIRLQADMESAAIAAELDENYAQAAYYWEQARKYEEEAKEHEAEYAGRWDNIQAFISGGTVKLYSERQVIRTETVSRDRSAEGIWKLAETDLLKCIDGPVGENESCRGETLAHLVELCEKADKEKEKLQQKVNELEASLNEGKCSQEMNDGMTKPGADGKSMIDMYRDLAKYDVKPMAEAMREEDTEQIHQFIEMLENAVIVENNMSARWQRVKELTLIDFPISGDGGLLAQFANGKLKVYEIKDDVERGLFKEFQDACFNATKNRPFYDVLRAMCVEKGSAEKKKTAKNNVTKIFEKAQSLFNQGLKYEVEGAKKLENAEDWSNSVTGTDFGTNADWSKEDEGKRQLEHCMDDNFLSSLTTAAGKIGDHAILMIYATEMFSDYSSPRGTREDPSKGEKNMAGVRMGVRVNYYYNSELEYLYNGNLADAEANLRSVAGMIFLIRFIFNYIASFSVTSVVTIVNDIRLALAETGPFAILISELARMGLAMGESALDVARLKDGEKVVLYKKTDDNWRFSISGFAGAIMEQALDPEFIIKDTDDGENKDEGDANGFEYTDYMRLFLLLTDRENLIHRVSKLIELNMTNYRYEINAIEEKMATAERFDMSNAVTDFSVTTTVDMRMLFLSMPFAQKGINGLIPPKTFPITATDYRGY